MTISNIKKEWIIGASIIGIGVLAFASYKIGKSRKKFQEHAEPNTPQKEFAYVTTKNTPEKPITTPLKKTPWFLTSGSSGKEVERLQIWLLRNHGWKGEVTGVFDDQTLSLVRKVFKQNGIDKTTYQKYKMGVPIHEQIKAQTYGN
ncbi:peptidoglycan-binding domain-containing protein [Aquimarina pacifica]|uniref:peptidoglycan-binding domain-containing protein n=1 Tax=Aquimarina pacifica TaxID=1296415 RepID=UPI0004706B8C|nr:hypothetical protein [Aquimarina pacifica]